MKCRHCNLDLVNTFLDLGFSPPSNSYLLADDLYSYEKYYPLRLKVCSECWLVQTEDCVAVEELFSSEYAYFSSTSTSWLAHVAESTERLTQLLKLGQDSLVIELASNDGYLLKNFLQAGIPCLGIEPTAGTAAEAERIGIPVIREFFSEALGKRLSEEGKQADLIIGNNVFAHVPDINDFTLGMKAILKKGGSISLEFPHLMRLIEQIQFDTVYHEHFSYLSLYTVNRIFGAAGLKVYDVEELTTHGGSLRVFGCHLEEGRTPTYKVTEMLDQESRHGLQKLATYRGFQARADRVKDDLLTFLIEMKKNGQTVAGYGAAAKGNTMLNYAGIKRDLLPVVFDAAVSKQGKFLPGSHIPILAPKMIEKMRPDYLLILPWNIADEVIVQNSHLGELGTKFVTAVPRLKAL